MGAACRPAYQMRRLFPEHFQSGPFDWTVTPFHSLKTVFSGGFAPERVLLPQYIKFLPAHKVVCDYSGLQFAHALAKEKLRPFRKGLLAHNPNPSAELLNSEIYLNAIGRFRHTYTKFDGLCQENRRMVFIRWIGSGLYTKPDQKGPGKSMVESIIEDDNIFMLESLLSDKYPELDFRIYYIQSIYKEQVESGKKLVLSISHSSERLSTLVILEENPENYNGDDKAWQAAALEIRKQMDF
ncbi:hypothetical protein [Methylomagnum ishizawai]|uniref:hypothetical protein n=1 Tax=Methylomagnum ishizawai TaxID=1760988 RepID=UPI0020CB1550|nr:hypothetical protein [Methylomagnum ishizawai]